MTTDPHSPQTPPPAAEARDDEWRLPPDESDWVPPDIDLSKPSVARVYDYALGGKTNFPVDRELYERITQSFPEYRPWARANRAFLGRAVDFMASSGIRQFLDLGAGIPTSPSVHELARRRQPEATVAYVDHDAIAVTHGRALLGSSPGVAVVLGDAREPSELLEADELQAVLDLDEPVGLLLIALMHFIGKGTDRLMIEHYVERLAPGSMVAISAICLDPQGARNDDLPEVDVVSQRWGSNIVLRTASEIEALFEGLDLVDPGVVEVPRWRPEEELPDDTFLYGLGGVGRVR